MKNAIFKGSGVAVVTPMNLDGSVNFNKFAELIEEQISAGTDALIVCGTTGESATLSGEEHMECIRFAVDKVNKRIPVIAGTGSNDTAYAAEMSIDAEKAGADALLLVTPYYNKTSQRGLIAHFTAIADAVNIPIILYNVPSRTGCGIDINTYEELSKHKNIVAVKEASGDISLIAHIAAKTSLVIYSGNDTEIVPTMSLGGMGVISVAANVIPKEIHEMTQYALRGDYKAAAELQLKYFSLIKALFCDVNPIPVKEAMNLMGKNVGECRLPLIKTDDKKVELIKTELEKTGVI